MLFLSVLFFAVITIPLNLNVTSDLMESNIEADCFNISFNWDWPLALMSSDELVSWSVLIHYFILSNSENGTIFIGKDVLVATITGGEFNSSTNFGGSSLTFWLEIDGLLQNGSIFSLYSLKNAIYLPSCDLPSTGVLCVYLCSVCVCACVCCTYMCRWLHAIDSFKFLHLQELLFCNYD